LLVSISVAGLVAMSLPIAAAAQAPEPAVVVVPLFDTLSPFDGEGGELGESTTAPIETEIQKAKRLGSSPLRTGPGAGSAPSLAAGVGSEVAAANADKSNPEMVLSFEGVNHRDSRLADNGNQFSGEPADQGVCVGNGYIMETVNSALRVFSSSNGTPLTDVLSLNQFYGFPPALDRSVSPLAFGPFTFDIYCHYDPDSNRWFHLAVDLEQDPATGAFTGRNYVDLAVSTSGDPTGGWNVYRIPGMNDGTEGTPDHDCPGGPCFADFPHLGVDENGVYITTNEFPLFEAGFHGAQVYAISKADLVAGAAEVNAYLFDTSLEPWRVGEDQPGFTVWPALSAGTEFSTAQNGTELFVSSNAVFSEEGDSEEIIVWALSNTASLDSADPSLSLSRQVIGSQRYAVPDSSEQKSGTTPLRDCINDRSRSLSIIGIPGRNCGYLFGVSPQNAPLGVIDTSDSRILDVKYAQNRLWAVLGTAVEVGGEQRAGVAWFIISPKITAGALSDIELEGILAVEDESLAYPTIGVTGAGRGVIGFTRVGPNLFPSQGYAPIDRLAGVGTVRMAAEGNSPQDGFTEYSVFASRARWGDYGAAAVDGSHVYLAGQYIEQGPCSLTEYLLTGLQCDDQTRTSLANWSTRVTKLAP
jgi:hypothetical protein